MRWNQAAAPRILKLHTRRKTERFGQVLASFSALFAGAVGRSERVSAQHAPAHGRRRRRQATARPRRVQRSNPQPQTFASYLESVTCGWSLLFCSWLRGWSAPVEHHPASASPARSGRSLTAAPRNEHNGSQHTAALWSGEDPAAELHPAQPADGHRRLDKGD